MRTSGSDELYRLIHSLTVEEKGYFKKFALRHTSKGNQYLQLFDAISRQKIFEEASLKKKFKTLSVLKNYLKEMITDNLLLYYRSQHPHIQLLARVQKVHLLMLKGMQAEAIKLLDKTIAEAAQMELHEQGRYLLRLKMNILKNTLTNPAIIMEMHTAYSADLATLQTAEEDLLKWELNSLTALAGSRSNDIFNATSKADKIAELKQEPAATQKGNILKNASVFRFYRSELNVEHMFSAAEAYASSAAHFKNTADSSYDDTEAVTNYLITLTDYSKFHTVIAECDRLLQQPSYDQTRYKLLFVRLVLLKSGALAHLGRFEEDLQWLRSHEQEFHQATTFSNDLIKQYIFVERKLVSLFLNKQYSEAWVLMQPVHQKENLKDFQMSYADKKMLEIMTQFMLGNFDLVQAMAAKTKKEFNKHKIKSYTYQLLFDLFIKAKPGSSKAEAAKVCSGLTDYYAANKKYHRKIFGILRYTYWLEEISGGRTIRQSLHEQFPGNE